MSDSKAPPDYKALDPTSDRQTQTQRVISYKTFTPSTCLLRSTLFLAVSHFFLAVVMIATQVYLNIAQNTAIYIAQTGIWIGAICFTDGVLCLVLYLRKYTPVRVSVALIVLGSLSVLIAWGLFFTGMFDLIVSGLVEWENPNDCHHPDNNLCPLEPGYTANGILMTAAFIEVVMCVCSIVVASVGVCRCCRICCPCYTVYYGAPLAQLYDV